MSLGFLVGPGAVGGLAAATTLRTSLAGVAAVGLLLAALAAVIRLMTLMVIVFAAIVSLAGVFVSAAFGEGPTRESVSSAGLVRTYPAGKACPFAVQDEILIDNSYALFFPVDVNGDTRVIVTGHIVTRITNLDNGKSVIENVSGPTFLTFHPDGSFDAVLAGRAFIQLYPTDSPAGPIALLNSGRLVVTLTAPSQLILHNQIGRDQNVCTILA
jgi:hypothetical protein